MRRLEGKRAVVTGGGSGIGRASALRFAREGASVLVVGLSRNTNETVAEIRAEGGTALGIVTDASVEENVAEIVRRCIAPSTPSTGGAATIGRERTSNAATW